MLTRNYSITRSESDREFADFYWDYLQSGNITIPGYVENRDPFLHVGFLVPFELFENDCEWDGDSIKPIFLSNWVQALYDLYFLSGYEQAMDHIYAAGRWLTPIYAALPPGASPAYCYRPNQEPSSGEWFWGAQDFPGIAIYYEFFGDEAVLPTLEQASEVYWDGGSVGYASAAAFALDRQKPDHVPPDRIGQIKSSVDDGTGRVRLEWENVADAARIQVKYTTSTEEIVDLHPPEGPASIAYWQLENVEGEPAPQGEGVVQAMLLDLPGDPMQYRFVMKAWDQHGNVSEMSAVSTPGRLSTASEDEIVGDGSPLLEAYPNPFKEATHLRFRLPAGLRPGQTTLSVYNVNGQRVRRLSNESLAPGAHSIRWDGTTDTGVAAPSGVYVVTLDMAGRRERMVVARVK